MRHFKFFHATIALSLALALPTACNSDDIPTPATVSSLSSDCIKRSLGPNVAGWDIEFVYAMALPPEAGRIVSARVEASIAGAEGTQLEHRSFHTDISGSDVFETVGNPCVTSGTASEVTFTVDTCAASLRYSYRIPAEAKGRKVEFTFSARAANGQETSYRMGPYEVSMVDVALDLVATDGEKCYLSVADMAVYSASEAASRADRIDLVYLYRDIPGITFAHSFVSPAAGAEYLPGVTLPAGVNNSTPVWKVYHLWDRHLSRLQYGHYVDDMDFPAIDLAGKPNYAINVRNEAGMWVETQDGKYRAYIYVNTVNPGSSNPDIPSSSAKISLKRYTMK
ncbi:MAG: DUF4466 family protein [Tannerella sp.]|jgi:hypothetical protein|nr:DUF4466 family protein [Tannerella sp.]